MILVVLTRRQRRPPSLFWLQLLFSDEQPCRGDANLELRGPRHRDEGARAVLGVEQWLEKCETPAQPDKVHRFILGQRIHCPVPGPLPSYIVIPSCNTN